MKLKIWEKAMIAAAIAAIIAGTGLGRRSSDFSEKFLRLHVVANSDTDADQAVKLKVRDAVLETIEPKLEGVQDAGEAADVAERELAAIEDAALECLRDEGYTYSVSATVAEEDFPTTEYDTFSLPAGRYRALRVTIGRGEGHNWWCVVFPNICSAPPSEDAAAAVGLSEEERGIITRDGPGYEVRFRLLELWGKLLAALG